MSNANTHLALLYLAQCIIALVLSSVLWYFGRIYNRRHLRSWGVSFVLYALHALSVSYLMVYTLSGSWPRLMISLLSGAFCYFHLLMLAKGTYEVIRDVTIERKVFKRWVIIISLLSILIPVLYAFDQEGQLQRYGLRVGVRELITVVAFVTAAAVLGMTRRVQGTGVKLVAIAFFLYGMTHLYYVWIVFRVLKGEGAQLPYVFGLIEIILLSIIGFGTLIWLLEDERSRLEKTNRELDSFVYSASHDLRAPIASILGLTNLAKYELEEVKGKEMIGMIDQRVRKLDSVIGDILQLSRTKKAELKFEEINFSALLKETLTDMKFMREVNAIALRYEENANHTFWGDYAQTKIVLSNLIGNAIKYHSTTKEDRFIQVTFQKVPRMICFQVEDNGEGIAAEHHGKIFEMFYRASTNAEGTGLGLYIVRESLTKIKGAITMRSEEGVGSTFSVFLEQPA